ncbi:MAG: DUF58 domain-containing protein [Thermoplasmata archaeon]|nr:DUF58 domain-containing protein [Thermoplasmata archaeon]MCI4354402.1 DUF58 domain-containing protein [Thermoplasmata archaeon]
MSGASPPGHRDLRAPALLAFSGGALLLVVAVLAGSPLGVFAALPLLMAPVAALSAAPTGGASAELSWSVEGAGADVLVRGTLRPDSSLDTDRLRIRFYRPPSLVEVAPPRLVVTPTSIEFTLSWRAPFPFLSTVPRPEVVWQDPLGLVEVAVAMEAPALKIERFPPEASRLGTVRLPHTTPQPGEIRSRYIGPSGDFFSVRAAGPTDTPRQINWRATARSGRLLANDFYLERTGDLVLLLDLRPSSLGPERDAVLLSIACAGALGIASGFLAEKARVGVGLFGEFLTAVPLGAGRLQRFRIAQALQKATLTDAPGPSERLAVSMRRYFPPGVTTVLLTPLADEESLVVVSHLRRRGYPTIVLSPSPIPLLVPPKDTATPEDQVALRLLRLVRRRRIGDAWREGPVVDWDDYWSLSPFVRFLSAPARPSRGRL